jgi:hypothetical protein
VISRKVITSILFTILIAQVFVPAVLFFPVKKFFKKCASIAIEKGKVEKMTLSKSDYLHYKVKGENELKIEDVYFDIERRIEIGDDYVLFVHRDMKETILFDAIAKLFGKQGNDKKRTSSIAFNIFGDCAFFSFESFLSYSSFAIQTYFGFEQAIISTRALRVVSPPPECTFFL